MPKFRKKPVVIEAVRFVDGLDLDELLAFLGDAEFEYDEHEFIINTLEGNMHVSPGDWIIRGVQGEFYPCKPDIFEATYELVSNENPFGEGEEAYV